MKKNFNIKGINTNIFLTIFQVISSGLVFFFLYKYLYETLGAEKIGLWSLLIGITAISRVGEVGLTGGVVKFISEAVNSKKQDRASKIIQTVLISLFFLVSFLIIISYLPAQNILIFATKQEEILLIKQILPYSFLSIFLMILIGVLGGSLDGVMLMGLKNFMLGLSHIFYLFLVFKLVPIFGLIGVAYSQCTQYFILLILMWVILKREVKTLPILPFEWDFKVIKDMYSYALNFQAISIVAMFFEPLIKIMMSYWGGLTPLGFYEMANKLIVQSRNIIVESSRIVVPITAKNNLKEMNTDVHYEFVKKTINITTFASFYIFSFLAISMPIISAVWFNFINFNFIYFSFILLIGYFISTLSSPVFLINLGTGHIRQNLYTYLIMASTSIILGNILGFIFEGLGVTYAVSFSLILSALYLINWYKYNIFDPGYKKLFNIYKFPFILVIMLSLISLNLAIELKNHISILIILILLAIFSSYSYRIYTKLNLNLTIFEFKNNL